MRIRSVEYVGSFAPEQELPTARGAEFAFVGRSNVGKSSLINTLVNRRNVARTSNTPGKTRTANFYAINDSLFLVDLPGYGFAQVSKGERARWRRLIDDYLSSREPLAGIVLLLDVRHSPSAKDREMSRVLEESGKPVCFVFNKIDKVKMTGLDARIAGHLSRLHANPRAAVIPFSTDTGQGKRSLWAWIEDTLSP